MSEEFKEVKMKLGLRFSTDTFMSEAMIEETNSPLILLQPIYLSRNGEYRHPNHPAGSKYEVTLINGDEEPIVATQYLKQIAAATLSLQGIPDESIHLTNGNYTSDDNGNTVFVIPVVIALLDKSDYLCLSTAAEAGPLPEEVNHWLAFSESLIQVPEEERTSFVWVDHVRTMLDSIISKAAGDILAHQVQPIDQVTE